MNKEETQQMRGPYSVESLLETAALHQFTYHNDYLTGSMTETGPHTTLASQPEKNERRKGSDRKYYIEGKKPGRAKLCGTNLKIGVVVLG